MPLLPRVRSLWNTLRHKDRLDRELDDELRALVETLTARYAAGGLDPRAARRAAVRSLAGPGGIEQVRDTIREHRIGATLDSLLLDIRYAGRGLRKAPGLTATIVVTLALGIGANTAIFSVVHAMLLKPLPYRDSDRLAVIWLDRTATSATLSGLGYPRGPMSGPDLRNLREGTRTFEDFGGIWASGTIALTEGEPEQLRGALVTTNFFQVLMADARAISPGLLEALGVQLVDGRFFTDHDNDPKRPVVIVDDRLARLLWPDRSAIEQKFFVNVAGGRSLDGESRHLRVVGVVRHLRLRSLVDDPLPQMFVPWQIAQRNPMAFVVRASGDPVALAPAIRATVASLDRRLAVFDVRPLADYLEAARSTRRFTVVLAVAFAATALLLTCVGVYGVLAFAVAHRRHEFGIRRALGADTARVIRDVAVEGLGFTAAGCAAGLAAALAAGRLLQSQLDAVHPRDPVSYGVSAGLILIGAIAACAIPAYRAARVSPMDALRTE